MNEKVNDNICVPVLRKQIGGLVIASVLFLFFGGPLLVLIGILTFADAWVAGVYKRKDLKSVVNISPMGWGIVMEGLLLVSYPFYLINRNKLKTKPGNNVLYILVIIFGAIVLLLSF
ncbi:hypothetical protein ACFL5X_02155, partial [Candidatus Omnitrophota bacterium]